MSDERNNDVLLAEATFDQIADELERRFEAVGIVALGSAPNGADPDVANVFKRRFSGGRVTTLGLIELFRDELIVDFRSNPEIDPESEEDS